MIGVLPVRLLVLLLALFAGGCSNMVFSEKPLFTEANSQPGPEFKPGVWAVVAPGCKGDLRRPIDRWPDCAAGQVLDRRGPVFQDAKVRERLVAGDPLILQNEYLGEDGEPGFGVAYSGVRTLELDRQGRIVAFESWPALCGPPPPPRERTTDDDQKEVIRSGLTQELLPGLKPSDANCVAETPDAVRLSVSRSRAWAGEVGSIRWIRAASRRDLRPLSDGWRKSERTAPPAPAR